MVQKSTIKEDEIYERSPIPNFRDVVFNSIARTNDMVNLIFLVINEVQEDRFVSITKIV